MANRIYSTILLGVSFVILSLPTSAEGNHPPETVIYLDSVEAYEYDLKSANHLARGSYGAWSEKGILFRSEKPDLKAFLNHASGKSDILIEWKKASLRIPAIDQIGYIRWRPKNNSFIYSLFDSGSGGDFGTANLHYVTLSHLNKKINMQDTEISSNQLSTDLGWDSNGKYYAYSEAAILKIKNFETGKTWAAKLILVDTKTGKVRIPEGTPRQLSGFIWLEKDKKLLFIWKNHPFDDAPVGAAVLSMDQFKLD